MVKNIESESRRRLRAESHAVFGNTVGCSDAGCVYGTAPGMYTNGGCCCMKGTPLEVRMIAVRLRAVAVVLSHKLLTLEERNVELKREAKRARDAEKRVFNLNAKARAYADASLVHAEMATGKLAQIRSRICRLNNFEPKQDLLDIIDKAPRRGGQQVARDIPVTIGTDEKSP